MNNTRTTTHADDEALSAVAAEIHREAPAPHTWESLDRIRARPLERGSSGGRQGLLAVAAASILALGVAGTIAIVNREDAATAPAASDRLPPVRPEGTPWTPVIEQPVLTADVDAIALSNDAADWADRALFPTQTPDGYTVESVSRGTGGAMTESDDVDTGDVRVSFITTTPQGTNDDPRIVIETVPAGIGVVESDVEPEAVTTGDGVEWDVYIEQGPEGFFHSSAYTRTAGGGGTLTLSGAASEADVRAQTEVLLTSLRLVRVEEIPTEVVDLNRLPSVTTSGANDVAPGFMRAARTTNVWCVVTSIGNGGSMGCGTRFDPTSMSAVFVELSFTDQNIVTLAGLASPDATSIEIDLADGTTLTVEPTFPDNAADGIGFWVTSHRNEGPIPASGPVTGTRVLDADGTVAGAVEGP